MGYVTYPVDRGPDQILDDIITRLQDLHPGWEPHRADLVTMLAESVAFVTSMVLGVVSDTRDSLYRRAGLAIFGVPEIPAAPAVAVTTWTVQDTSGYAIPQGTEVGYLTSTGDTMIFRTTADVVIPSGQSSASGVEVTAITPGSQGNGLTGPVLVSSTTPWVTGITQPFPTSGGEDGETDEEYLARLPREIEVQRTPVRERDFQAVAMRIPGVGRAVAIDGWNTVSDTLGNEKTVGVVVATTDGLACSTDVKAAVKTAIEAVREVNFIVGVTDPAFTSVTVTYAATAYPGFTTADVKARVDAAILAFLSPATWGMPTWEAALDGGQWLNEPVVRVNDVVAVIDSVQGVRAVTAVQINGGGDLTMAGRVPLPSPQPPVGTVTAT